MNHRLVIKELESGFKYDNYFELVHFLKQQCKGTISRIDKLKFSKTTNHFMRINANDTAFFVNVDVEYDKKLGESDRTVTSRIVYLEFFNTVDIDWMIDIYNKAKEFFQIKNI